MEIRDTGEPLLDLGGGNAPVFRGCFRRLDGQLSCGIRQACLLREQLVLQALASNRTVFLNQSPDLVLVARLRTGEGPFQESWDLDLVVSESAPEQVV